MSKEANYIRDVLAELVERGRAARAEGAAARAAGKTEEFEFYSGKSQGLYEAISVMDQQLTAFGMNRDVVGLPRDLDLENELL